jgi:hypothetical protein
MQSLREGDEVQVFLINPINLVGEESNRAKGTIVAIDEHGIRLKENEIVMFVSWSMLAAAHVVKEASGQREAEDWVGIQ